MQGQSQKLSKNLSSTGAFSFALGTSLGWGSLVVTTNTYLANSGPAGSVLGILAASVIMLAISRSYAYLMESYPDAGGAFTYVKEAFGWDHGFLAAWFLALTYMAVFWANATSLPLFARYFLGLCFEKARKIDDAIKQWEEIYKRNKSFRDVASKLQEYKDLQANDYLKDYLTCSNDEFPEICLNIRRAEILTLGSIPFTTLLSTIGYSFYRYYDHDFESGYFPNPLAKSSDAANLNDSEQKMIIATASGISLGIGLTDLIFNYYSKKQKQKNKQLSIKNSRIQIQGLEDSDDDFEKMNENSFFYGGMQSALF